MRIGLGAWVRARRLALGMPRQADLAARMGGDVDPNYVAQVESGRVKVPSQPHLARLAAALGVAQADVLRLCGVILDEDVPPAPTDDVGARRFQALLHGLDPADQRLLLDIGEMMVRRKRHTATEPVTADRKRTKRRSSLPTTMEPRGNELAAPEGD